MNTAEDPLDLDEKVLLADKCMIPGSQSVVVHVYPKDHDDGTPVNHHDASTLS